jgi:hypothetical protein
MESKLGEISEATKTLINMVKTFISDNPHLATTTQETAHLHSTTGRLSRTPHHMPTHD